MTKTKKQNKKIDTGIFDKVIVQGELMNKKVKAIKIPIERKNDGKIDFIKHKKDNLTVTDGTCRELKRKKKLLDFKNMNFGFKDNRKLKKHPESTFLIEMLYSNGTSKTFVIKTNKNTFSIDEKIYYLFYEECYFDLSMNQFRLIYHESCPVPINREIMKIGDDTYFSVTPDNLKPLVEMRYLEVLTTPINNNKINWKMLLIIGGIVALIIFLFSKTVKFA